jgi:hypothetical protein
MSRICSSAGPVGEFTRLADEGHDRQNQGRSIDASVSAAARSPPGTACAYTFKLVDARAWLSRCDTTTMGTPAASGLRRSEHRTVRPFD